MIQENNHLFNRLRVLLDVVTVTAAYFLTFLLFFYVFPQDYFFGGTFSYLREDDYCRAILYLLPIHIFFYAMFRMYAPMRFTGRRREAFRIFSANLISLLLLIVFFWLFIRGTNYSSYFSRMFLAEFGLINTMAMVIQRNLLRLFMRSMRKKGFNHKTALIVGYSRSGEALLNRIRMNPGWGYTVRGILDDTKKVGYTYLDYKVIGRISDLASILEKNEVEEVYVTLGLSEYAKLESIVSICEKSGVQTKFVPDYANLMSNRPYTEELLGLPVIYVRQVPLNDLFNACVKRAVDIVGSLFAIILFSPVFLITALLIKLTSPGPVIYRQERIGLHNRPFMMYKFRSMVVQTEESEKKQWTTKNDPRVTKIGSIIRKTSIDEFPQFFNVLFGSMSLIGPRPERPQFVEQFREEIPRYMIKHQVRPGITGWAQVNGLRGDTSIEERINYDIYYIENWSLGFDFKILVLTFFKGFINKNAY